MANSSTCITCFVIDINTKYKHINAIFSIDYEPSGSFRPTIDWDKLKKEKITKKILFLKDNLERENPNENIKIPISECGKYITLKYSKYCKFYGIDGEFIDFTAIKSHTIEANIRVLKYDFIEPILQKRTIGIYLSVSSIKVVKF